MSSPYVGENDPMPPLLNADDFDTFSSLDNDFFLAAVGDRIRQYLGWHLFPSTTTSGEYYMTGDGTILLPTRHLTAVVGVAQPWSGAPQIDSSSYFFDKRGWIRFKAMGYGFAPSPASANLWPLDTVRLFDAYPKHDRRMAVTFTHGFDTMPPTVAAVGYELVMRALEKPAGVAKEVNAGPYKYVFDEFGFVLSDDQKNRLAHYKLPGIV